MLLLSRLTWPPGRLNRAKLSASVARWDLQLQYTPNFNSLPFDRGRKIWDNAPKSPAGSHTRSRTRARASTNFRVSRPPLSPKSAANSCQQGVTCVRMKAAKVVPAWQLQESTRLLRGSGKEAGCWWQLGWQGSGLRYLSPKIASPPCIPSN